jgi:hypothetical protein
MYPKKMERENLKNDISKREVSIICPEEIEQVRRARVR